MSNIESIALMVVSLDEASVTVGLEDRQRAAAAIRCSANAMLRLGAYRGLIGDQVSEAFRADNEISAAAFADIIYALFVHAITDIGTCFHHAGRRAGECDSLEALHDLDDPRT